MRLRKGLPIAAFALATLSITPLNAATGSDGASGSGPSLIVKPHLGAQAIDVSGHAAPGNALSITLVSTFDRDLPDVVLSRTFLATDPDGTYAAVVSIAPGYLRGSIITVFVTASGGGPATTARYLPDAPNRGVVIPYDEIPREDR